jgi:cobalamin biosynthesis protein CobD/CbiB
MGGMSYPHDTTVMVGATRCCVRVLTARLASATTDAMTRSKASQWRTVAGVWGLALVWLVVQCLATTMDPPVAETALTQGASLLIALGVSLAGKSLGQHYTETRRG